MVELKNRELLAKAMAAGVLKSQLLEKTNELGKRLVAQSTRRFSCSNPLTALEQLKLSGKRNRLSGSNTSLASLDGKQLQQRKTTPGIPVLHRKYSQQAPQVTTLLAALRDQPLTVLPKHLRDYVEESRRLTGCKSVHVCDGSEMEREWLIRQMLGMGMITPLRKHENCWLARTDPKDVARVESKTFICTRDKHDVVPRGCQEESRCSLGNWMHVSELEERMAALLPGCMSGRTMYVIPFSMGPLGSNLSKVGIQLTDSPYVVASMHIMTRVSRQVLEQIGRAPHDYVKCFHSVGCPLPSSRPIINNWPCNPEQTIIAHIPARKEIISYGSGYGGNSLLGKKCFALRLGSIMGKQEGWLAEHMLILGLTNLKTQAKKYIAAAFPSACGKTNLAMMTPSLPGYKVECVGDDIAWMRFDERDGTLRAINPEAGFFGVAPGTSDKSNPNAMRTVERNTIFTNVAETSEGAPYWEGLESTLGGGTSVTDWRGEPWWPECDRKAAHPNSRFCSPASQCPIIDPEWESPAGVPISAIIFGGRRPEGVPLVYEAFDWEHGVYVGASMRSESTAAAEHTGKTIMHDPFAMRPFFGYNFGEYLKHWLSFGQKPSLKLPKVFHVNWFRRDSETGDFLWPGFGENIRVLDWVCRRIDGEQCAKVTPIGWVPTRQALNTEGLGQLDTDKLFAIERDFWLDEQRTIDEFLRVNLGQDLPQEISEQSKKLRERLIETSD